MARNQSLIKFLTLCVLLKLSCSQPYANDFPYMKYGFKSEGMISDTDGNRYLKNNLRDRDDRLKSSNDKALSYNLDSDQNEHNINQLKRGGSTDNLTHLQGENFENDKTHKRKHIKSGFQNSYHKDENGSRSSFYEDSDDTGGKVVYDKRHGTRGDNQENQFQEGLSLFLVFTRFLQIFNKVWKMESQKTVMMAVELATTAETWSIRIVIMLRIMVGKLK